MSTSYKIQYFALFDLELIHNSYVVNNPLSDFFLKVLVFASLSALTLEARL